MKKRPAPTSNATKGNTASVGWIRITLAFVVVVLYVQTISFDFTLDDESVYVNNELVQNGVGNIGRIFSESSLGAESVNTVNHPYRPITMLSFALDKSLFNASSRGAHLINLLLYVLLIQVLYSLLRKLFPDSSPTLSAAIALLFAAHPVHSEVVASVKSRDEILAALFGFMAWSQFISHAAKPASWRSHWTAAILLTLALFAKESSIVFTVLIPLSSWLLLGKKPRALIQSSLPLLAAACTYLIARQLVVGHEESKVVMQSLDNVLFSAGNINEAIATRLVILFQYLKLLFVPWPLVWDYSYHQIPLYQLSDFLPWIGGAAYVLLFGASITYYKKRPSLSFSILFFLIALTPVSNLFFINATPIAERLLFVPSLGFCIGISLMLINHKPGIEASMNDKIMRGVFIALIAVFSSLTIKAAAKWKNNLTLFSHGVEVSPNSARTHFNLGIEYWKQVQKSADATVISETANKAIAEMRKSLDIYPDQFMAMTNLGCLYDLKGEFDSSRVYFEQSLAMHSDQPVVLTNISNILNKKAAQLEIAGKEREAINRYLESSTYDNRNTVPLDNLGQLYARKQAYDSAYIYFNAALAINSEDRSTLEHVAVTAFLAKDYDKAISFAQKHIMLSGNTRQMLGVLSDCYYAKGNYSEVERLHKLLEPGK